MNAKTMPPLEFAGGSVKPSPARTITTALVAVATYEGLHHNPTITAMAWIFAGICWALATDRVTIEGSN